jgi:uncharacterized membrane protein (DUF485 family)
LDSYYNNATSGVIDRKSKNAPKRSEQYRLRAQGAMANCRIWQRAIRLEGLEHQPKNKGARSIIAATDVVDWDAIIRDPRFQSLHRRKSMFLWGLMVLSVSYYFLLPIGAAYFQDVFKIRVWGVVNVGLLFALSEFLVAWVVAWIYSRKASQDFDLPAVQISADFASSSSPARAGATP